MLAIPSLLNREIELRRRMTRPLTADQAPINQSKPAWQHIRL
jgi:hypothetical protein